MKRTFIVLLTFIFSFSLFSQEPNIEQIKKAQEVLDSTGEVYILFTIENRNEIDVLTRIISIDNVKGNRVFAYANRNGFEAFLKFHYPFEVIPFSAMRGEIKMGLPLKGIYDWDTYPTYEEYIDMMYQFETDYPQLCKICSIDTSVEGREILYARITDSILKEECEPEFMYSATMHGDETAGYVLMLRLINYLLTNYGSDSRVTRLVDSMEIWINPLANPDGTYAGGNNTVAGATRSNANYVDLNRNYRDPDDGDHPDGNSWQPEVTAVMNFTDTMSFVMAANFHGGAEVVNYPWDTWSRLHTDDTWYQQVSRRYADSAQANSPSGYLTDQNNGITNGYAWYSISGGRQDYMNYFRRCRETTIELSDIKLLSASQLPYYWNYNKESFLGYMESCFKGIHGIVKNQDGEPLYAEVRVLNYDSDADHSSIFTDPDNGDFYRLLSAGTYTIVFQAAGYETDTVYDVALGTNDRIYLTIILHEIKDYILTGIVTDSKYGFPVSGARVHLISQEGNPVLTNAEGRYFISGLYPGIHTIKVSKPSYMQNIDYVTLSHSDTIENFVLEKTNAISFEYGIIDTSFHFIGDEDWCIDTLTYYEGYISISSGNISHDQSSGISLYHYACEQGEISFFKKLQTEANFDFLNFYIDDEPKGQWSGFIDWSEESFSVDKGVHTYKWEYCKDPTNSSGLDMTWLDFIKLPPTEKAYTKCSGCVTDAQSGDSLSGAIIELYADNFYQETSNMDDGCYNFDSILADTYYIKVWSEEYDTVSMIREIKQIDTVINFQLYKLVSFFCTLVDDSNNNPIYPTDIQLFGNYYFSTSVDTAGHCKLENFPQGHYYVVINTYAYHSFYESITVTQEDTSFEFRLIPVTIFNFEIPLNDEIFSFGGQAGWFKDTTDACEGLFSLRSGMIADGQESSLILGNIELLFDDSISFYRKVSSEFNFDVLEFYINDSLKDVWSGEWDWEKVFYPVCKGKNTFTWRYIKDQNWSYGSDAAWIDYIELPLYTIVKSDIIPRRYDELDCISIYPVPCNDLLHIKIICNRAVYYNLTIYNSMGNTILLLSDIFVEPGENMIPIRVDVLEKGFYVIEVRNNQYKTYKRFIKAD